MFSVLISKHSMTLLILVLIICDQVSFIVIVVILETVFLRRLPKCRTTALRAKYIKHFFLLKNGRLHNYIINYKKNPYLLNIQPIFTLFIIICILFILI